jgi:hypothetical protein
MWCRASNHNMRRLAEKHGADIQFTGDEAHGTLKMPFPTPASILEEVMGEAIGLGGLFAKLRQLAWHQWRIRPRHKPRQCGLIRRTARCTG